MTPMTHALKTWPMYWDAIETGAKTFEVRRDDRKFCVGDTLVLWRWDPAEEAYTPGCDPLTKRVSFVLRGGNFGIEQGFVVMGLQEL